MLRGLRRTGRHWVAIWLLALVLQLLSEGRVQSGSGLSGNCPTREQVISMIGYYADDVFRVDKQVLFRVAEAESSLRHCVPGDGGQSVGVFQLHARGAWNDLRNPWIAHGLGGRLDPELNIAFSAWYLKTYGHMCPWTTFVQMYPHVNCR